MSKLAAIASMVGRKATHELHTNQIHLIAGAIGAYTGAKKGYAEGQRNWSHISREERGKYRKAYGSNAQSIYSKKKAISGSIRTASTYYHTSRFLTDTGKDIAGRIGKDPRMNPEQYYGFINRGKNKRIARLTPKTPLRDQIKNNVGNFIKEQVRTGVKDLALEHGVSNIYGEIAKHARIKEKRSKSNNSNKTKDRYRNGRTGKKNWKATIHRG